MENLRDYTMLMVKIGYLEGLSFGITDEDIYDPLRATLDEMKVIIDRMILGDGKDSSLRSE